MKLLRLVLINEKQKKVKEWRLKPDHVYMIGRGASSDILVDHSSVSRTHCKIKVLSSGSATLEDLNSSNGTMVDGRDVKPKTFLVLVDGINIRFGDSPFTMKVSSKPSPFGLKNASFKKTVKEVDALPESEEEKEESSRSRSRSKEKAKKKKSQEELNGDHQKEKKSSKKREEDLEGLASIAKSATEKKELIWHHRSSLEDKELIEKWSALMRDKDKTKRAKFFKLLGVREDEVDEETLTNMMEAKKRAMESDPSTKYSKIQKDLERQYEVGVQHRHNRKGLGFK